MNLRAWIFITLLTLTSDHPIFEQQLEDEVSFIQQEIGVVRFDRERMPTQRSGTTGQKHGTDRARVSERSVGSSMLARDNPDAKPLKILNGSSKPAPGPIIKVASGSSDNPDAKPLKILNGSSKPAPGPIIKEEIHYVHIGKDANASIVDILGLPIDVMEKKHILAKYVATPLAIAVVTIFTISTFLEKFEVAVIPEAAVMIIVGMVLGAYAKDTLHLEVFNTMDVFGGIIYSILNLLLLPIIIFTSGWSLRRQDFFSQFPYILLFAIVGVVITASVVSVLIHWTGASGFHGVTSWRAAFAYGTLVSATDPVTVLVTYQKHKVDPLLNILVYGEATINNAVAIVLFHVVNRDIFVVAPDGRPFSGWELGKSLTSGIVVIFFSSAAIGFVGACIAALVAHAADMRTNKKGQILMILGSCYLTYAVAESFGKSGIIANLFCGIFSGIYLRPHLSEDGSVMASFFLQQVATLADSAVFVLVGICAVQTTTGLNFPVLVVLFCLLGRAVSVFPLSMFSNLIKRLHGESRGIPRSGWNLISPSHMFMIWHAGLRGGIAIALSMELGSWVDRDDVPGTRQDLQTATFLLVWVCLVIFGGSTVPCLRFLGIKLGKTLPPDHLSKTEHSGFLRDRMVWLDQAVLAPVLIGRNMHQSEVEPDVEDVLKRASSKSRGLPVVWEPQDEDEFVGLSPEPSFLTAEPTSEGRADV